MPKQLLGTGGKHRANSPTAVRMVWLRARRAEALDYRKQGYSFAEIGKQMKMHPSTAHDYVVRCLQEVVPKETAETVLQLELERLNQLQSAIYDSAADGNTEAIKTYLAISHQRSRLLGLYPNNDKHSGVNFNIGPNAPPGREETAIRVCLTLDKARDDDDPANNAKLIEHDGAPVLIGPLNGRKP